MRDSKFDEYKNVEIIGNNIYDIKFASYIINTQGINTSYCDKFNIDNEEINNTLYNMAHYYGSTGPFIMDEEMLIKVFAYNNIPLKSKEVILDSEDIIEILNRSMESDLLYICNKDHDFDKYTMFILGYLLAKGQEIMLWNEIDPHEWLMSSLCKKSLGTKEFILYPIELIRYLVLPKLDQIYYNKFVTRYLSKRTEFNLNVEDQNIEEKSVCLLGSLNKHLNYIKQTAFVLENEGYKIIAPKLSEVKTTDNGFIIFDDDISNDPVTIESDFIEKCLRAEKILICDKDGYVGNTVAFEIGYLLAKGKTIEFTVSPTSKWILDTVKHFENNNKVYRK